MAESEANDYDIILEAQSEHSEFGASIGSTFAGNNEGCVLFYVSYEPNFMHGDKFYFASVSSAQASKPKTISADFLSKIWNIDNSTATKVLYQNT